MSTDAAALFASGGIRDHKMVSYCELRLAGLPRAFPTLLGGNVIVDVESAVRRRCTVDLLAEDELIPDREDALLYPGRAHIHLWRGIDWNDDRPGVAWGASQVAPGHELWPLGVFLHTETVVANTGQGVSITIGGGDLSRRVQRAAWTAPHVIAAGASIIDSWSALIADRWPDATISPSVGADDLTPRIVYGDQPNSDPWEDARTLGSLLGAESFVNVEGTFDLATIPDPLAAPIVARYRASTDGSPTALTGTERRLDADKGYSAVVMDSNRAGGAPLRSVVEDTEPSSPTYVDGDYGLVPLFVSSSADTQAQIDTQAAGLLRKKQAAADAVTVTLVANPAHEERDVLELVDPATRLDGLYTLDGFTMPLDARTAMTAQVRRVLS